tara:strand:+ start:104 stop:295 length:192 start_codon:yes stop_codon:yes gene_type:complete
MHINLTVCKENMMPVGFFSNLSVHSISGQLIKQLAAFLLLRACTGSVAPNAGQFAMQNWNVWR